MSWLGWNYSVEHYVQKHVVHCDIKLDNILISKAGNAISDFGEAVIVDKEFHLAGTTPMGEILLTELRKFIINFTLISD